jgi:hypothetical protein
MTPCPGKPSPIHAGRVLALCHMCDRRSIRLVGKPISPPAEHKGSRWMCVDRVPAESEE